MSPSRVKNAIWLMRATGSRNEADLLLEVVKRLRSRSVRGRNRAHIEIVHGDDPIEIDRLLRRSRGIARVAGRRIVAVAPEYELFLGYVDDQIAHVMARVFHVIELERPA